MVAPQEYIEDALNLREKDERPLVLVGGGMAWSRAEDEVRAFLECTQIPFLSSSMGKVTCRTTILCRSRQRAPWHCRTPMRS
jgi:thiamine pyrophosphate-dependent acetolactate synthase large subunit-like protein